LTGTASNPEIANSSVTNSKIANGISPTKVGLGNVNNTSDLLKPISNATQVALDAKASNTALDLKAPIDSPTFTGTISGISKTMVGLGNIDNTTDLLKPISNATQAALDLKASLTALNLKANSTDLALKADITDLNLKAPVESPTFTGTKTNLTLSGGELRLTSLASEGVYLFSAPIDLGGTFTSRITASITQYAEDPTDLFDTGRGFALFDSATGSFDGNAPAFTNSHLEIATSADNITYTSFRNFVVGDYTARYYKFKMRLTSLDAVSTPVITALSVTVDMQDRIFSGNDITSGSGTYSVVFTLPFYSANYAVGITAQGMATGDFFQLTSKTTSGFNIAFKNSSNTGISKTFDYIAKGY
jgi:hypothetical protein